MYNPPTIIQKVPHLGCIEGAMGQAGGGEGWEGTDM